VFSNVENTFSAFENTFENMRRVLITLKWSGKQKKIL
jgi:hypothetical protein